MPPKKKPSKTREEILEEKRKAERLRYNRLKNDPKKREEMKEKERQKYQRKKEKGTRKLVSNMSRREHKAAKNTWRDHCATYRAKKKVLKEVTNTFVRENTPDSECSATAAPAPLRLPQNVLTIARRKQAKKKREEVMREKDVKIQHYRKKLEMYKKRLQRLEKAKMKKNIETPNTKLTRLCNTPETRKEVVKKALFGEVLNEQLKENYRNLKTFKEKQIFGKITSGKIVKKYKLWRSKDSVISYKRIQKSERQISLLPTIQTRRDSISFKVLKKVQIFYESDDNSRICAGKREFITRKGVKKQKRYLLDSIFNLYKKFKNDNFSISYPTFCRLRPFWVVIPKINERDTCYCIKHANIDLKLSALYNRKILRYNNYNKLLEDCCCNRYDEKCLSRECQRCANKNPEYREFDDSKPIQYKKWVAEKQDYKDPKSKKARTVIKYLKRTFTVRPRELIQDLHEDFDAYFCHERNNLHQYRAVKDLKGSLNDSEAIIHMDFSENYCTKYSEEIQAYHFGGSRLQLSLHTVVVYTKYSKKSYCTVSQNTTHSPAAIWAHLKPIFKSLPPYTTCIHFVSDGPVTQYRNKTMFYIMASRLHLEVPSIEKFSWNYSESGHGKSAADGVGATCKRTADAVVATGGDIDSLESFIDAIQQRCPKITIFTIGDETIQEMIDKIQKDAANLKTFSGTLKTHQVKGKISRCLLGSPLGCDKLIMKSLSCFCNNDNDCEHFNLGVIKYEEQLRVEDVYTDSECEDETRSAHDQPDSHYIAETDLSQSWDKFNTDFKNIAGPSNTSSQYNVGDYVLVKFPVRNLEYRYAAVINQIDNEEGELRVTYMKICDDNGHTFRVDENDISDVSFDQILEKLPNPDLRLKGKRYYYYFPLAVPVFEK